VKTRHRRFPNVIFGILSAQVIQIIAMQSRSMSVSAAIICLLAGFSFPGFLSAQPQRIVIIRHGEKPQSGDNLSCAGLNRSLALPNVIDKKIGAVTAIFVPSLKNAHSTGNARMYQTVVPYAIRHNLPINSKYEVDDVNGLVAALRKQQGTVLVVWEHRHIDNIAKALGIQNAQKWDESDFDSIWVINLKTGGAQLAKDREQITPATACQ
jgi:hypothetical protein